MKKNKINNSYIKLGAVCTMLSTATLSATSTLQWSPTAAQINTLNSGGTVTNVDTGVIGASGSNVLVTVSTSAFEVGGLNLSTSNTGNNQFSNARPSGNDNSGNTFTFTFSEAVSFSVTSEAHSFFGDNEIIEVNSSQALLNGVLNDSTVGNTLLDGSLQTSTIDGSILTGANASNTIRFEGNSTLTTNVDAGTFWTVDSGGSAVTSFSVSYRREGEPNPNFGSGTEPFTIDIVAAPIPEPSSVILSTLGSMLIFLRRKR